MAPDVGRPIKCTFEFNEFIFELIMRHRRAFRKISIAHQNGTIPIENCHFICSGGRTIRWKVFLEVAIPDVTYFYWGFQNSCRQQFIHSRLRCNIWKGQHDDVFVFHAMSTQRVDGKELESPRMLLKCAVDGVQLISKLIKMDLNSHVAECVYVMTARVHTRHHRGKS